MPKIACDDPGTLMPVVPVMPGSEHVAILLAEVKCPVSLFGSNPEHYVAVNDGINS